MTGFSTPADERRAAAFLVFYLQGDSAAYNALAEDGLIPLIPLMKAVTAVFPESYMDLDAAIARAEAYRDTLVQSEHGLLDDDGDG
jgi:hypothetical protein